MKPLDYIVDGILATLVMFFFTFLYFGLKQDSLIMTLAGMDTATLVNEIRGRGYLTKDRYDEFLEILSKTGLLYDITLEHRQLVFEPEYRFRTADEIIEDQNSAYTGKNEYVLTTVKTDIPAVSDPISSGTGNTETNESVLAAAVNTPADAGHVHTNNCYSEHRHTGSPITGGGCYIKEVPHVHNSSCYQLVPYAHIHTSYCYADAVCTGTMRIVYGTNSYTKGCPACGGAYTTYVYGYTCDTCGYQTYVGGPNLVYKRAGACGYSETVASPVTSYKCGQIVGKKLICGLQEGITYYNSILTCGKTVDSYDLDCGLTEDTTPDCSTTVISISATHSVQTVYRGDPIISTIKATYLDGSTKTIVATASGYDNTKLGNQTVTLTYSGLADNAKTTGTKTCTIAVTVIPMTKICTNGHTYNLNGAGSDPGCPYCRAWLKRLEIIEPATGSLSIYRGTTLKENGVTLQATYLDGHTELVTDGYADNLDKIYVGPQNVTISYKGFYVNLSVVTKRNIVLCLVCSRYYELYPNDTDPGCPYCAAKTPVFTGNVKKYYLKKYTDEILQELYKGNGIYYFAKEDYFIIKLENSSRSLGGKYTAAIYNFLADGSIKTQYGGYIRKNGQ